MGEFWYQVDLIADPADPIQAIPLLLSGSCFHRVDSRFEWAQVPRVLADAGGAGTVFALPPIENLLDRSAVFFGSIEGPARNSFKVEGLQDHSPSAAAGKGPGGAGEPMQLASLEQGIVLVRYTPGTLDEVTLMFFA
jgi:hypothetical protein